MISRTSYPIAGTLPSQSSSFTTIAEARLAARNYETRWPPMGYSTATEVVSTPDGYQVNFGRFTSCD